MDELISFDLIPSTDGYYIVDNLQINKHLFGFSKKKKIDGVMHELNVYDNSVVIFEDADFYNTYEIFCNIKQGHKVYEQAVNRIKNILNLFKSETQGYAELKIKWEKKSKIYISI